MKMSVFYEKVGALHNETILFGLANSTSDCSTLLLLVVLVLEVLFPLLVVAECQLSQVGHLIWRALTPYLPNMVVPAKCWRSSQILAFSKVGTQLKITETRQSISLQPGVK